MSKPAQDAVAEFHKCPKTSDEIRVKGFSYCPFCGAKTNADGDHVVVTPDIVDAYRAQQAARPKPAPEPPRSEAPKPPPAPPQPKVKSAEEIEKLINDTFGSKPATATVATSVPPTGRRAAQQPAPQRQPDLPPQPPKPRSSAIPLLIFAVIIGGGAYAAWNTMQPPAAPLDEAPAVEEAAADPAPGAAAPRDLTDTGSKPNPDITSAGRTLIWRSVDNGLVREIRSDNSNIRALPTTQSKILNQLQSGDLIRPSGRITDLRGSAEGEWYRIEEPTTGYVRFGNTKTPSRNAKPPTAKPTPTITVYPVNPPGLRVRAGITLRVRSTPSRSNNSNDTGNRIQQGETFMPDGYANDIGRDPGRIWYKVDGGFVAEWETDKLTATSSRPPSGSTAPTPRSMVDVPPAEIDAGDRGGSSTSRALDALRRPREEPAH